MKLSWKLAILGYILALFIGLFILFIFFLDPHGPRWNVFVFVIIIWLIVPILFSLYGLDRGKKEESIMLKEQHFFEIKQLLKEHKTITQMEEKIKNWKDEGYNVSQLEKMIDDVKQPMVKKQKKAKEDLIDKEKNKYCHKCSSNIEGNPKFCKDCGTEL